MGIPLESSQGAIPAYAGSTEREKRGEDLIEAHPRLRGEHTGEQITGCIDGGSSPLTRGTLAEAGLELVDRGLISAYAGNTARFDS